MRTEDFGPWKPLLRAFYRIFTIFLNNTNIIFIIVGKSTIGTDYI